MPHTQQVLSFRSPVAPFVRSSPTSQAGAQQAQAGVGSQMVELLTLYRQQGPLTDYAASQAMGIYRTSVIPRRRELMKRGLVEQCGQKKNPETDVLNAVWGLVTR